jgi:hypothetical protein
MTSRRDAIFSLCPGAKGVFYEDPDIPDIWEDERPKPSEAAVSAERARLASDPAYLLERAKVVKLVLVNQAFNRAAEALTAGYPAAEIDTWHDQKIEALAWHANNSVATPYIDALASYRGIPRLLYLEKTVAKVLAFTEKAQRLVGTRQKYADQIALASTVAQVDAVSTTFTLA